MLFMVIERFRNRDPKPIYRRLRDEGREMSDGLRYVDSWIEPTFERCFQLMECDDARLLQQWIVYWRDLMEFEIVPVVPSKDTRELITRISTRPHRRMAHNGRPCRIPCHLALVDPGVNGAVEMARAEAELAAAPPWKPVTTWRSGDRAMRIAELAPSRVVQEPDCYEAAPSSESYGRGPCV